jgi:hypothetical protein
MVNVNSISPRKGIALNIPTHVPSNGFRRGDGVGEVALLFVELSLVTFGFAVRFGFALADCSGLGVGLSGTS